MTGRGEGMRDGIDMALEVLRRDVGARGLDAVSADSGLAAATVRKYAAGARPKRHPARRKLLDYAKRRELPRNAAAEAAPAEHIPAAKSDDGAPRDSLRDRLAEAMGYDRKTGRSASGVSLAAGCMGVDRDDLKRLLDGRPSSVFAKEAAEAFLDGLAGEEFPRASYDGPKWALCPSDMGDWMLDEMDALEAANRLEAVCGIVPGGAGAARRYAQSEAARDYLDESDWIGETWEVGRAARLALGCANPMERGCATLAEYAARLAAHSLPEPKRKAA